MRSTVGQLIEFRKSFIWQDILEEMDIWLDRIRSELENPDLSFSHRTLDQLGGCAKAVRNMKDVVDVLINLSEDEGYEHKFLKDLEGGKNARRNKSTD